MKRVVLILVFVFFWARTEVLAAQCSSYYISEINIVSVADTDAGNVQTAPTKFPNDFNAYSFSSVVKPPPVANRLPILFAVRS